MKLCKLLIMLCAALTAMPLATLAAGEIVLNGQTFTLPDGFTIEQIAGPPLVDRPIVADFDEQGRLYVAESSGSNDNVQKQLAERPHRILRLEDTDGDGRFDRRTIFADAMMFPEGAMWRDGSLYVAAPPSIWKLTDSDDDGVADHREEWFEGKTLTGCANDLHGPYAGPDGWIYWCKGAFAEQTHEQTDGPPLVTRAAHIFRCRTDGSGLEPVMTGGMDNPVDVVFTPGGERIFTTTFLQHPGGGRRDGLIHAIYGGVYGKWHDVINGHPRTGELMPVLTHLGPAAPSGLAHYESRVFGEPYQGNLFAALFNLRKVTRHVLVPHGATFVTEDHDFLVSSSVDFHPTDVLADADGSLIVVDTGGWYKLCCPTSQLWKPDVLGAIYRVRREEAPPTADPRGRSLDWTAPALDDLTARLADSRPAVARRAQDELARRGPDAVALLAETVNTSPSADARRRAVWTLTRIDHPTARAAVRQALTDADHDTRQAAIHAASIWRDRAAIQPLMALLEAPSAHHRRAAAEALGRIGDRSAVDALLAATRDAEDRVLEHSLIYALLEIGDSDLLSRLAGASPRTQRAIYIALDQLNSRALEPRTIADLSLSPEPLLRETADWILDRHPAWGDALAEFLDERLRSRPSTEAEREHLERQLIRFAGATSIQQLMAAVVIDESHSAEIRELVLRAMAQAQLATTPAIWIDAVVHVLVTDDGPSRIEAIAAARAWTTDNEPQPDLDAALARLGRRSDLPVAARLDALAAISSGLPEVDDALFQFLASALADNGNVVHRRTAADVLSKARLGKDQLLLLAERMSSASPLEADRLLAVFAQTKDEAVGRALVAALAESSAFGGLQVDAVKKVLAPYPASVRGDAEQLYEKMASRNEVARQRIEQWSTSLATGDPRRGQAVFNSSKAACSACHAIGYIGGASGPDLTRIGQIRTERDLLEAILFPSASFVRSYEPLTVVTTDGRIINGVLRGDDGERIVLATGPNEEARIERGDIDKMHPSTVSIMPAGLEQQLSPQELADLIAFLKASQ